MHLSDQDIREFQELWRQQFEESLTEDKAREEAMQLLELYALLARPLPRFNQSQSHEVPFVLPQIDRSGGSPGLVHRVSGA